MLTHIPSFEGIQYALVVLLIAFIALCWSFIRLTTKYNRVKMYKDIHLFNSIEFHGKGNYFMFVENSQFGGKPKIIVRENDGPRWGEFATYEEAYDFYKSIPKD